MKKLSLLMTALLLLSIFVTIDAMAAKKRRSIRARVEKLSDAQLERQMNRLAGTPDTWKDPKSLWQRSLDFKSNWERFQLNRKMRSFKSLDLERFIYLSKFSKTLPYAFLTARKSVNPDLNRLAISVRGERVALLDHFSAQRKYEEDILVFLVKLYRGQTDYEVSKFDTLLTSLKILSEKVDAAAKIVSSDGSLFLLAPLVIELESSSINSRYSPIVSQFSRVVLSSAKLTSATKDGGIIATIDSQDAPKVAQSLRFLYMDLKDKDAELRPNRQIFSDEKSKQEMIQIYQNGKINCSSLFSARKVQSDNRL